MKWEELEDALEVLQSEREYDGYFCSIKDAVIIVIRAEGLIPRRLRRNEGY